jgi:hypothetical protein
MTFVAKTSSYTPPRYQCKYCSKLFVRENMFLQHKCKDMIRAEELQTPIGQAALNYYVMWMKTYNRIVKRPESFAHSKYYRTFIEFAKFVKSVKLPDVEKFLWLMKEKDLPPSLWKTDEVYSLYIEFLDNQLSPLKKVKISIDSLVTKASALDVDISDIFSAISINEILHMLRTRQLSPWLLLESKKFKEKYKREATEEQKILLETFIRPDYWIEKRKNNPKIVEKIRKIVSELNI